jgi:hypothetical protein
LSAGATYRIGNQQFGGANEVVGYGGPYTPASDITIGLGWGNNGTTFARPAAFSNPTPYVGPVFKYTTIVVTNTLTLISPKVRQIIQRNGLNLADLHIRGHWSGGSAVQLQARAVVMTGDNNGVPMDWTPIVQSPIAGDFDGVLPGLAGGGWYQIEVRALDAASNVVGSATVTNVGVGDIFITAGQSNAGCYGSPTQSPGDDRVSAYTLSGGFWRWASDPQPDNSGGGGAGGSPWPVLGTLWIKSNSVPVGFVSTAYGSTTVTDWQPGGPKYAVLKSTLQAFGTNGVRAVLWHQGESDSLAGTTAASYAQLLGNIVVQSRLDAGWPVPWGIAEASAHPSATLGQQEPVACGQRQFLYANSQNQCFRGARTDDLNLQNEVAGDGVHFNAIGLADHAQQWADAILGTESLSLINGNFESNTNVSLSDGQINNGRTIGWNWINSQETGLADGSCGYFNPGPAQYSQGADTINGGVMTNMDGSIVASMSGGSASNSCLQIIRAHLQPSTIYKLQAAIGVRDNGQTFGGYQLDILADGAPVGLGASGDVSTLDSLAGGNATGRFTMVSCTVTSAVPVAVNQQLAIRIRKLGGTSTYLDFDNVRLTSELTAYGRWQMTNWGSILDTNSFPLEVSHGVANLVSFAFGIDPHTGIPAINRPLWLEFNQAASRYEFHVKRRKASLGLSYHLQTSEDLKNWTTQTNIVETVTDLGDEFEEAVYAPGSGDVWSRNAFFGRIAVNMP